MTSLCGRCYGGPWHGEIRTGNASLRLVAKEVLSEPVDHMRGTEPVIRSFYVKETVYVPQWFTVNAVTGAANKVRKDMVTWVAIGYQLTNHDLSRMFTDLNHEHKWKFLDTSIGDTDTFLMQVERADVTKRGRPLTIRTELEHGPAPPDGFMRVLTHS